MRTVTFVKLFVITLLVRAPIFFNIILNRENQRHQNDDLLLSSSQTTNNREQFKHNKPRLILHVGPPKTASTTIQNYIKTHLDSLQQDNFITSYDIPTATNITNPMNRVAWCLDTSPELYDVGDYQSKCPNRTLVLDYVSNFLADARNNNHNVLMSAEILAKRTIDTEWLSRHIQPHFRVQVIVLYRRLYDWIASRHFQSQRHHPKVTFAQQYSTSQGMRLSDNKSGYDWFVQQYTTKVAKRYSQIADEMTIVNMHDPRATKSILESVFCHHISDMDHTCRNIRRQMPSSSAATSNKNTAHSLDNRYLLAEAIRQGLVRNNIPVRKKRKLTKMIQKRLERMGEGNSVPQKCLPQKVLEDLLTESITLESQILSKDWVDSDLGIQGLRDDFATKSKTKLCSIDTKAIFENDLSSWKQFFSKIK